MRGRSILMGAAMALGFAAAALPAAAAVGLGGPAIPMRAAATPTANRRISTRSPWAALHRYPNGPGWTYAQVKRMARKKRNQARNRRAHK